MRAVHELHARVVPSGLMAVLAIRAWAPAGCPLSCWPGTGLVLREDFLRVAVEVRGGVPRSTGRDSDD
jgi:hypothetical protein